MSGQAHTKSGRSRLAAPAPADGAPAVTTPVPRRIWEEALRSDPAAVVSQGLAWRDAVLAGGGYADASLLYEFGGGRRVVVPMASHRRLPDWVDVAGSWPARWGVAGPISPDGKVTDEEAAVILADLTARWPLGVEIQFRHGAAGQWLRQAAGYTAEYRTCHVLDLTGGFSQVWQDKFAGTARTAVRKAEKSGVTVERDGAGRLLGVFSDLYDKSIQRWAEGQHEPVWLARWRTLRATPPKMLEAVSESFAGDCQVWVARLDGEPVASIIVLKAGGYAKYWRGAMDRDPATRSRANDLLHKLAIEDACADGRSSYDMGGSRPGSPLARFKEKLGAEPFAAFTLRAEKIPVRSAAETSRKWAKKAIGFRDI